MTEANDKTEATPTEAASTEATTASESEPTDAAAPPTGDAAADAPPRWSEGDGEGEGGVSPLIVGLLVAVLAAVAYGVMSSDPGTTESPGGSDPAALLAQAREAAAQGQLDAALPFVLEAAKVAPADASAQAAAGDVLANLGRAQAAIPYIEKAVSLDPTKPQYAFLLGRTLTGLERHAEAEAPLRRALELAPDDPEPLYFLAIGAMRRDDWATTVEHLEAFTARAGAVPSSRRLLPLAMRLLADAQEATGQPAASVATLTSLANLMPGDLGVRMGVARRRMTLEGLEPVIDEALAAAAQEDADLADLCVAGHLLAFDPDRGEQAREPLERARKLAPERPEPLIGLALEQTRDGDLAAAQETLEALLKLQPQHGGAKLLLAQLHRQAGRTKEARAIYEGLRGTQKGPLAEQGILATYLDERDAEEALTFVRGLFPDAEPGDPRRFLEARALQTLGKFEASKEIVDTLRESGRDEDKALWIYYGAMLHIDAGELEKARAAFDRLELPYTDERAQRFPSVNLWAGVAYHPVDPEKAKAMWRAGFEHGVDHGERAMLTRACGRLLGELTPEQLAGATRIVEWTERNDGLVLEGLARELAGDLDGAREAYADAVAESAGDEFPARVAKRAIERLSE